MPQQRKPYETDLYKKENIVAYTGNLHNNPTVYFIQEHGNGLQSYGHITQNHKYDVVNIGREEKGTSDKYKLVNEDGYSCEYDYNIDPIEPIHPSRGPHTRVNQNDKKTLDILAQSIDKFPGVKKMSTQEYVNEQLDVISQNKLEDQPDQLHELLHDVKKVSHQMIEIYPDDKEVIEQNQEVYESQIIHANLIATDKIKLKQINEQKNEQKNKDSEKKNEKSKLSSFSKPLNKSNELNGNQQSKLNTASHKKDQKQKPKVQLK